MINLKKITTTALFTSTLLTGTSAVYAMDEYSPDKKWGKLLNGIARQQKNQEVQPHSACVRVQVGSVNVYVGRGKIKLYKPSRLNQPMTYEEFVIDFSKKVLQPSESFSDYLLAGPCDVTIDKIFILTKDNFGHHAPKFSTYEQLNLVKKEQEVFPMTGGFDPDDIRRAIANSLSPQQESHARQASQDEIEMFLERQASAIYSLSRLSEEELIAQKQKAPMFFENAKLAFSANDDTKQTIANMQKETLYKLDMARQICNIRPYLSESHETEAQLKQLILKRIGQPAASSVSSQLSILSLVKDENQETGEGVKTRSAGSSSSVEGQKITVTTAGIKKYDCKPHFYYPFRTKMTYEEFLIDISMRFVQLNYIQPHESVLNYRLTYGDFEITPEVFSHYAPQFASLGPLRLDNKEEEGTSSSAEDQKVEVHSIAVQHVGSPSQTLQYCPSQSPMTYKEFITDLFNQLKRGSVIQAHEGEKNYTLLYWNAPIDKWNFSDYAKKFSSGELPLQLMKRYSFSERKEKGGYF